MQDNRDWNEATLKNLDYDIRKNKEKREEAQKKLDNASKSLLEDSNDLESLKTQVEALEAKVAEYGPAEDLDNN